MKEKSRIFYELAKGGREGSNYLGGDTSFIAKKSLIYHEGAEKDSQEIRWTVGSLFYNVPLPKTRNGQIYL